jgi:hypothetical protein
MTPVLWRSYINFDTQPLYAISEDINLIKNNHLSQDMPLISDRPYTVQMRAFA